MLKPAKHEETPVLVVGGGPTGLTASLFLSQLDIPHILIERRQSPNPAPAAHVINTRTMEIFRQGGLPMDELYALDSHPEARLVTWSADLSSPAIGALDIKGNPQRMAARAGASIDHVANISQPKLEQALMNHTRQQPDADIRPGWQWLGFGDDAHESIVQTPDGNQVLIRSTFTLAADGASSPIARALGIEKEGPETIARFLNLSCRVDLRDIVQERDVLIHWCLDLEIFGTLIVHDPENMAVFMVPMAGPEEDYDEQRCAEMLKRLFGKAHPYELLYKGVWNMSAQVAEKFRSGPVFLIGDSAHRFPPTGGLGLNSGVCDAHNLVWKLAAVLKSTQSQDLLDSYELERRPVAQRNCAKSHANNDGLINVLAAIGLDLLDVSGDASRAALASAGAQTPEGAGIRQKVQEAIEGERDHFDALGMELGFAYGAGAAVSPEAATTPQCEAGLYEACARPGALLPHVGISGGSKHGSLKDILDYRQYTLISFQPKEIPQPETFGLPVKAVDITGFPAAMQRLAAELQLEVGRWILVRPDGHIAARG